MTDKIRVSKWFDEWFRDESDAWSKNEIIGMIGACQLFRSFYDYKRAYSHFDKEQYQEIRDRFEDYVKVILGEEFEVEEEKTPLGWIPSAWEDYWHVGYSGIIYRGTNASTDMDYDIFTHTKIFKTQKEAEFEAEKMKVTRELEQYACNYKTGKENYYLYASLFPCIVIKINFSHWSKEEKIYFESEKKAQKAIKAVGEDRILKYYFGVEV